MRRPIYVLVFGGVCDSANAAVCFCGGIDETTVDPAVASCRADRLFVCRVFRLQCVYHFQRPQFYAVGGRADQRGRGAGVRHSCRLYVDSGDQGQEVRDLYEDTQSDVSCRLACADRVEGAADIAKKDQQREASRDFKQKFR